ncbi:MAG TPA: hypothetical protein DHV26_17290 [Cytophagales bacterium]|nr:hypothetical protein [Cytophagales bacterium]
MVGATGTAFTVKVTGVAGPMQLLLLVSVTNTVRTKGATELNPKSRLAGLVPVVSTTVNPALLYQVYVLPAFGVVISGGETASPTQ